MNGLDQDYEMLTLAASNAASKGPGQSAAKNSSGAQTQAWGKREPIERFASIMDTEAPRFEKQRQESLKNNIQGVSATS
jgi:hypothetical protein